MNSKIKCKIGKDILKAKELLDKGDIIGIPTETVYGLASNALNEQAVLKIYKAKNRPKFDPLIIHTSSLKKIKNFVEYIPEKAIVLAQKFWPGPLTLLLKKKNIIPDIVTSGLPKVAIRIPNHPLTLSLLEKLDYPLAAPSANIFGYISPTNPKHVYDQLKEKIKYILDGGECKIGLESTIIDFEGDEVIINRLGGITIEEIEKFIGKVKIKKKDSIPNSPGMLDSHYAPKKNLYFVNDINDALEEFKNKKIIVISFYKKHKADNIIEDYILSLNKDLKEAAHNLFKYMREADRKDIDLILAEKLPDEGLGKAINDRLLRASINKDSKLWKITKN
ncbi:MAG: threonylcarbamoyl-AMP synthase [Bacteroidetes bacterium]|nr:threonylcarbamoyl-AMP synthase [Bacteroidota bacterium]